MLKSSIFSYFLQNHSGDTKRRIYARGAHKQHFQTSIAEPLWCHKGAALLEGCSKAAFSVISCRTIRVTQKGASTRGVLISSIFKHRLQRHSGATNGRIYMRSAQKQHVRTVAVEPLWCHGRADLCDECSRKASSNTCCRATLVPQTDGSS